MSKGGSYHDQYALYRKSLAHRQEEHIHTAISPTSYIVLRPEAHARVAL